MLNQLGCVRGVEPVRHSEWNSPAATILTCTLERDSMASGHSCSIPPVWPSTPSELAPHDKMSPVCSCFKV